MENGQDLDKAFDRLTAAISKLEAAAGRRLSHDKSVETLEDDLQRLAEDRSQLAATLDEAEAKAERLEAVNREVSRRLVSAMETIRAVLVKHGG
ncbi:hypothetical protein A3843_10810 [Pseudovibrio exalbescens]|uniref:DUF4164 domain-containing protein n=2 Tax=Pseudovibrio exalbescens TaxID=197461 RepID=A0A1U7JHA3_9HYPH|nr:DUF4164 domain-containing protein [Pseudovibrio exalbescens]OKL44062.1 hypothetical protein A3843_10810 [Pseudovibrio exalbescens]